MGWKKRDPNKKSNYHKFERIVPKHKLAQVRQEEYNRAINQGASPHTALVKCLNSVGIREKNKG
tara:strand:+ start:7449 stop:7640 length:192 start_codon:yes stop_codon:yes gene_type:complete